MTTKFEQLIEYVINDEEAKAKELFHDIVVEKSREIYENLMNEEEEDLEEAKEEDSEEEELDEAAEEELDEAEEELDETAIMNDELSDSIESEEEGMQEGEEEEVEFDAEEGEEEGESSEDLEDRVVDLEDKLDELMAEFESLMGDDDGIESDLAGEEGDEVEGDALAADDTMSFADEGQMMEEGIELTKVAAPKHGDDGANNKSVVAFNSGAAGMEGAPVKATGTEAKGRPAPTAGKVSSDKFQNEPATGSKKLAPAPKPHLAQATGVNTKTPFPKG